MSDKKIDSGEGAFERINLNYNYLNRMMVEEMAIASEHCVLTGSHREEMWMKFFRSIIPRKFAMAQGVMIIDSEGHISKEIDIAVYDEQYTPYVFQHGSHKFIPIEAVAVVIECKSDSFDNAKLKEWADKIIDLQPKRTGIARMVNGNVCGITNKTQSKTRPIRILVTTRVRKEEKTIECLKEELSDAFHFIIHEKLVDSGKVEFIVIVPNEDRTLGWWAKQINGNGDEGYLKLENLPCECEMKKADFEELKFEGKGRLINTLKDLEIKGNHFLTLNFQLNQLLMLLNNPMLFPHFAYAKRFQEIIESSSSLEESK